MKINVEKLKEKLKLSKKGLAKKVLTLSTISVLAMSSLVGCSGDKKEDVAPTSTTTVEQTTESTTEEATESKDEATYTQEMWNEYSSNAWTGIQDKINNINEEDFKAALMILNIDYLNENNPEILREYYGKGIDVENELNKLYSLVSQIREYNTTISNTNDLYSLSNLLIEEKDQAAMTVLESLVKEIMILSKDLDKQENIDRINEIFNVISVYSLGESRIRVELNGQKVDLAQIELSKGGVLCSELNMQVVSVLCQPVVSEEKRTELDNSLRSKDVIAQIEAIMIENNAIASVTNPEVSTTDQALILDNVNKMIELNTQELAAYNVTAEEAKALFVIVNIDYFMDSTNNSNVFAKLYPESFDINATFTNAESAVRKIEEHNLTVGAKDAYNYGHLFITNEKDIISVRAIVENNAEIRSEDKEVRNNALAALKAYNQYSSQGTVTYNAVAEDGTVTEKTISLDKNALSKGANQLVDWIEYYTLLNNKSIINNEQFYNDMMSLVNGTVPGFTVYNDIVFMVEDFCAENNIEVYNYNTGELK